MFWKWFLVRGFIDKKCGCVKNIVRKKKKIYEEHRKSSLSLEKLSLEGFWTNVWKKIENCFCEMTTSESFWKLETTRVEKIEEENKSFCKNVSKMPSL